MGRAASVRTFPELRRSQSRLGERSGMSLDSQPDPHVSEEARRRVRCGELSNRFTATLPLWSPVPKQPADPP